MRQSIIVPPKLENIFINVAEESGLIKALYNPADELYNKDELREAKLKYYAAQKTERQNLFRILMLFDDIILPSVTLNYDYKKIVDTGMFSLYYLEDMCEYNALAKEEHEQYAMHLKNAILPVYEKYLKSYFRLGYDPNMFSDFVSDLYECILLKRKLPSKYNSFVEMNQCAFDIRNSFRIEEMIKMFGNIPESLTKNRFFTDISVLLQSLYDSLSWQLEISSKKDAAIWDCEFQLSKIGCEDYYLDVNNGLEAYKILRVECGNIIGNLPEVDSIQEVLRIKEQRKHDLRNLRQELSRLEYEIRNGSSLKAVEKAANDITKASKSLSHGLTVGKVGKWTNLLSVPIGTAALCCGKPEISIGLGALSIIGNATSSVQASINERNKWFEILI